MMVPTSVLIIEDDPNIVDLLRSNLVVRGFHVVVSSDGSDAIDLAELHRPDIALVDLTLPGEDGFELCRHLRERSGIGIIVVSARGREDDKVRAPNLGADDDLTKPNRLLSHAELLRRVWGPGYATETEYTRVYVRRLRSKLGLANEEYIVTEPRQGYRFVGPFTVCSR